MTCGERSSRLSAGSLSLTERGEMWAQYNQYKTVHKQLAKGKAGEAGTVRAAPQPGTDPL